ncbi:triphosphoribosyl-dephospho-CoA synthase [Streptomyces sp. NBC_01544]|uniref:triphosphoribosyl-dephospho-CoA synthase n=1 Tax=unclassified Streptomyces TaxID=2593676 RepID=UPI0028C4B949|nr:triphosphoribosyl-dephospho-CoA synthase [Streptomyces sp. AM2-3-1]WNO62453.1 triphosphoribosyl-dephospho-CoA synthase [Streptomyces sp. AM2-3-1]WTE57419.1 triphosphoribosyl-dephospho-CoA synthase [Streptomyces sp. NBC_01617]WTI84929.1 triphosphoribosyl-dephospho-CoA synthase [Streptomyces sp. NBC_00724]
MTTTPDLPDAPAARREPLRPDVAVTLGALAAQALRDEAMLTPKPGLVDARGGAHDDMNLALLLASADALAVPIALCAKAAASTPLGPGLRALIGAIGRDGEQRMLHTTAGVNTHRGALWALGLLAAGLAATGSTDGASRFAARLAAMDDPALLAGVPSHGDQARLRYGASGARGEAQRGFPHARHIALPMLEAARAAGLSEHIARTDALLASMATLEDTCLLHRGGPEGLRTVREGTAAIVRAGGSSTAPGRALFDGLDAVCRRHRLSAGGSGDVLAAALFLDSAPFALLAERSH